MKFGVVLCSRCETARGTRLSAKTAVCPKCGKKIHLKKAKIFCKVKSEKELAEAVMQYNATLKGRENIYSNDVGIGKTKSRDIHTVDEEKSKDVYDEIISKIILMKGKNELIFAAAKELCIYLDEFTVNDLKELLNRLGFDGDEAVEGYIAMLLENNVIYQPKEGFYRCIDVE